MPKTKRRIRRILRLAPVLALLVGWGVALPLPATAATSTASPADGTEYVALGDSYAAGYGLAQPTDRPVAACGQSALDYPHLIASSLGLDLTDVSCAGATTADIVSTRQHGADPQAEALGSQTKVVTVSIGGNDAGLFSTASKCIAVAKEGPVISSGASTCRSALVTDGVDSLAAAIDGHVTSGLRSAFATIASRAPQAKVIVVGYPAIFPDAAHTPPAGCFRPVVSASTLTEGLPTNGFPFTATDVKYLSGVQDHLDDALRSATKAAGFTYVSTLAATRAHSGCSTSGSYMQGITLIASAGFSDISLQRGALHPNAAGARFLAAQTGAAVAAALAPTPSPSPTSSPAGSDGFTIDLGWIVFGGILLVFAVIVLLAWRGITRARADRR